MATIGDVSEEWVFVAEWKIKDFLSVSNIDNEFLCSPLFSFANASWYMRLYPNGITRINLADGQETNSIGYIDIHLCRSSPGPPISLEFSLGLKTVDGKFDPARHYTYLFRKTGKLGSLRFFKRSVLLEMQNEFIPSGVLTLICKMKHPEPAKITSKSFY